MAEENADRLGSKHSKLEDDPGEDVEDLLSEPRERSKRRRCLDCGRQGRGTCARTKELACLRTHNSVFKNKVMAFRRKKFLDSYVYVRRRDRLM